MAKKQNAKKSMGKGSTAQEESQIRAPGFHIAAIGASAGSLDRLEKYFPKLSIITEIAGGKRCR